MKKMVITASLYTVVTAVLLGIVYPLIVTGISSLFFHDNANGQLIVRNGDIIGSRLIGQPFTGPRYLHSRPSTAGAGYDAGASSGSNLGPSSKSLVDRVNSSVQSESVGSDPVPVDLVTASGSGLDPDISPAAALYQVPRIAHARGLSEAQITALIKANVIPRQFGLLGEPRVNVVGVNLLLDSLH